MDGDVSRKVSESRRLRAHIGSAAATATVREELSMRVNPNTVAATVKLVVAAGAIAVGALALGAPAAHADDAVVDQSTVVEQQQPSVGVGDESTSERRKARVYVIGKTTKPHTRQG
jgi:hypothetical protein